MWPLVMRQTWSLLDFLSLHLLTKRLPRFVLFKPDELSTDRRQSEYQSTSAGYSTPTSSLRASKTSLHNWIVKEHLWLWPFHAPSRSPARLFWVLGFIPTWQKGRWSLVNNTSHGLANGDDGWRSEKGGEKSDVQIRPGDETYVSRAMAASAQPHGEKP